MLHAAATATYLFAPMIVASGLSAIVLRFDLWRALRVPIDAGRSWHGRRIFGDSKTWRGVVVAIAGCALGIAVEKYLIGSYPDVPFVPFALAMGGGAALGELPNSFVKRRLAIAPGKTTRGPLAPVFYLWDQVDLLIGAWPFVAIWVRPEPAVVIASLVLAAIVHPTISLIGYLIGARKTAR